MDDHNENTAKKLIENLQNDLRSLTNEVKKKYPQIKDLSEAVMMKLRTVNLNQSSSAVMEILLGMSTDILHPFLMASKSKQVRLVQISLTAIQRFASHKILNAASTSAIVNELWALMESEMEELRLLQTAALLVTSGRLIQGEVLSKCLVVCFRLNFAKDPFVINTASATVRQLVAQVFERLHNDNTKPESTNVDLRAPVKIAPKSLSPAGADAFMMFQDLCRLVSAEPPFWLLGITEMTRTLGLDLLEMIFCQNVKIFTQMPEFVFLLKDLVCPLVIKLFSPNLKYHQNQQRQQLSSLSSSNSEPSSTVEKPYFPIAMRLMRLVSVLIGRYSQVLSTECEIFLSHLVKFLENDKIEWQRALAIEIIRRIVNQRHLLRNFCENYDMKPHSSKVLKDLTIAVENFLHSAFSTTVDKSTGTNSETDAGDSVSQPGFVYNSTYIPFVNPASLSITKLTYLEMVEKVDPPTPPDGYIISLAFVSITETIQNIQLIVEECGEKDKLVCQQLIASTQNSLLSSLTLLLETSVDDNLTEILLKSLTTVLRLSCKLEMTAVRDAYLATLCKAALPSNYFSMIIPGGLDMKNSNAFDAQNASNRTAPSNVVAVSMPCPVVGCPSISFTTPVMLTGKNLQAVRALLLSAQLNGTNLRESWHLVLITLQHMVWLLNLKPTAAGTLKPSQTVENGSGANTVLTTAVMAEMPVLTSLITRLFESSSTMDIVALHHVINGLCALSNDAMQISAEGREPSFFAVSKLMEITLFNLHRAEQFFKPVSSHFVELSFQPYSKLREWGGVALITVIKAALSADQESSEFKNPDFQRLLLAPLSNLNENPFEDIRLQQIECVLHILRLKGQLLSSNIWPSFIDIIGAVPKSVISDSLIRLSFQAVQLLAADLLPYLPSNCLLNLIEIVAKFGSQFKDLNISLSAVGVLWNISDYLYRNGSKSMEGSSSNTSSSDQLWLALYTYLSELCVDGRPAVRKSACQTLFGTINSHGNTLQSASWSPVLWHVLFPLLDKVRQNSSSASNEKVDSSASGGTNILIHHSRDTESKQWAETVVLTLAGVCKVFSSKRSILHGFSDYSRAWATLLEYLDMFAVCRNAEISSAALRSFHELLCSKPSDSSQDSPNDNSELDVIVSQPSKGEKNADNKQHSSTSYLDTEMCITAWRIWLHIAAMSIESANGSNVSPTPVYFTSMLNLFVPLFSNVKNVADLADFEQVLDILKGVIAAPVAADLAVYILPTATDISPTQEAVLNCLTLIYQESLAKSLRLRPLLPKVFTILLTFVTYCCRAPNSLNFVMDNKNSNAEINAKAQNSYIANNLVPFAEHSLRLVVDFYSNAAHLMEIIEAGIVTEIIKVLTIPLSLKYECPSDSSWKLSLQSLLTIVRLAVTIAKDPKLETYFLNLWPELADCMEKFLFNKKESPRTSFPDEKKRDEFMDCQVIEVIRSDILPYAKTLPLTFISRIMDILYRGSIHDNDAKDVLSLDVGRHLRTDLSRVCFEALLEASRGEPDLVLCSSPGSGSVVGATALNSLLKRCRQVINMYSADERRAAGTPLPRHRVVEMTQVLTAVGTLIESLHRQTQLNESNFVWSQLIEIYPFLIDCVPCQQTDVQQTLMKTLKCYKVMLRSP